MSNQTNVLKGGVLGFRKTFDNGYGLLYQAKEDNLEDREPVNVRIKTIRTADNTEKKSSSKDLDKSVITIQRSEFAILDKGYDTLILEYPIKIADHFHVETATNSESLFIKNVLSILEESEDKEEFDLVKEAKFELSKLYANRIVSGVAGWRNRDIAEEIDTEITLSDDKKFVFKNVNLMGISTNTVPFEEDLYLEFVNVLHEAIFKGKKLSMKVVHYYKMKEDMVNVYPSQELLDQDNIEKKKQVTRKLFVLRGTAALTDQKINNALRRIDSFSTDKTISLYETGVDLNAQSAFRTSNKRLKNNIGKTSFYAYKEMIMKCKDLASICEEITEIEEWIYIIGILIKGGVWSSSSK